MYVCRTHCHRYCRASYAICLYYCVGIHNNNNNNNNHCFILWFNGNAHSYKPKLFTIAHSN